MVRLGLKDQHCEQKAEEGAHGVRDEQRADSDRVRGANGERLKVDRKPRPAYGKRAKRKCKR